LEPVRVLINIAHTPFSDQLISVSDDYSAQLCTGTLEQVLSSARKKDGALLNALSFPLSLSEIRKSVFSSNVEAWRVTEGLPYCGHDTHYPTSDMRWGLAATACARHWIHIDCDGLCTVIDPLCGKKIWFLFSPHEEDSYSTFGDIDQFSNGFDVTTPPDHWSVEAVYLTPGTRL
jgi:hypothetical protein